MSSSDDVDPTQSVNRTLEGPDRTEAIAGAIGRELSAPRTIALTGPLGAGKTTFVRGLVHEFGAHATVRSPTFTLINEYPDTDPFVAHADLYRAETAEAQETIGLEDYFDRGILIVEWAGRWVGQWPENTAHAHLEYAGSDAREIHWSPRIEAPLPTVDKAVESS
jgi:tRNA threonylcarbamoyladenosine biosynthesis protein TsaE